MELILKGTILYNFYLILIANLKAYFLNCQFTLKIKKAKQN